ncbi:MAG TPA: phenylalanine--tRNA ligase subunit alpha [Lachnospiraceae bacterium]|nr:phenylalanine--tRNA ligase subunit alpha [Lachnospiraceae bacterium]
MKEKLNQIREKALKRLEETKNMDNLEALRVELLGKKGELTQILKAMGSLSKEERPIIGQYANEVRGQIEAKLEAVKADFAKKLKQEKLNAEKIDVTMPGKKKSIGHLHPMTKVIEDIKQIFIGMGYEIVEGPEVETAYYNFEALNIPKDHPARDEQDTFYVNGEGDFLLRTQTSPMQIRTMETHELPIKIIAPGRVYRSDEVDATHSPIFHQLEGMVIDKNITMGDLKGALAVFAKQLFGKDAKVRFRPHHFPFTEPSAEMDVSCFACGGKGCRVCKDSGWIEVLGCGMVHPEVLKRCNIDPEKYSGFAFGLGLERIAMQKYSISDLRLLYENDTRFLEQF